MESLNKELQKSESSIIVADYDSIATDINKMLSSNKLPDNLIVLEKAPEITTGKMLVTHGAKAYGNSRMLNNHFIQVITTVIEGKVWTYPKLTTALVAQMAKPVLNNDSISLIQNRLSPKEIEVIYFILDGLTNDTIASELNITTRTVKAHVSSIFSKLHVSDRLSLVLLLK